MPQQRFHSILRKRIEDHRNVLINDLGNGAAKDYPYYREIVGRIMGLKEALDFCEDIEREYD